MIPTIFDSHAHYDDDRFDPDREELISGLFSGSVEYIINPACDLTSCQKVLQLAHTFPRFYAAVGIHPHSASEAEKDLEQTLARLATDPKVVAIGEIGLDYHYDFSPRPKQLEVFSRQLALAKQLELPAIIHSREATADVLALLDAHRPTGVVHCFSGSAETAKELLEMGYYIGFTGSVTFKNARKLVEAAAVIPDDRLLIETDAPYMAPEPYRGRRNDSSLIPAIAMRLAEIRGTTPDEILRITRENALRLFSRIGAEI
ncbi:MAG: TatD family deoxyribonuclease [Ruminococcaceae bacterium]|nr:TatD family deoxyribonuclease [Oscillospiraceae bacterium]